MLSIYPPSAFDVYKKARINFPQPIDAACEEINKACVGLGTDEATLVKVLGSRTPNERALISYRYKDLFGKSLRELVKSETSGDFGYLLQLLCLSLPEAESHVLYDATKGAGTLEQLIYPIILGRSNEELSVLKKAFFDMHNKDLSVMMSSDLSGDFKKIIMTALQEALVEYKSSFHTKAKAEEDAELLYKAGEGKWGTDENIFVKTLLSCPPKHLEAVNKVYEAKHGHGLTKAIKSEFSGVASDALVFFVRLATEPWQLLAEHFENTMKGIGTDEKSLSAAIVRFHPYLSKIKPVFESTYKISLRERVHGDTNGKYRDLCLTVMDAPSSTGAYA